jgi:hypothetical protein
MAEKEVPMMGDTPPKVKLSYPNASLTEDVLERRSSENETGTSTPLSVLLWVKEPREEVGGLSGCSLYESRWSCLSGEDMTVTKGGDSGNSIHGWPN